MYVEVKQTLNILESGRYGYFTRKWNQILWHLILPKCLKFA